MRIANLVYTECAVQAATDVYGSDAATAVVHYAFTAHFDGREDDFRFWCVVFRDLAKSKAH
ncbi:MAG: hypothetical protein E5Y31_01085 [Mesorhizobium sp.]|nr:MAG: hypothetical protein E5Y31_01085 [Mesorhizobium sp.]